MAHTATTHSGTGRRDHWFALACAACAVWVMAYLVATRLVIPRRDERCAAGRPRLSADRGACGAHAALWPGRPRFRIDAAILLVHGGVDLHGPLRRHRRGPCSCSSCTLRRSPSLRRRVLRGRPGAIFPALWTQFGSPLRRWRQTLDGLMVVAAVPLYRVLVRPRAADPGWAERRASHDLRRDRAGAHRRGLGDLRVALTVDVAAALRAPPHRRRHRRPGRRLARLCLPVNVRGIEDGSWLYTGWQAELGRRRSPDAPRSCSGRAPRRLDGSGRRAPGSARTSSPG